MNQPTRASGVFPVRILIVDDHPNTATTLARAVSQLGNKVEVFAAASGREALECVKGGAADILITDMIMPEMNGLELVEKLQSHPGGRPAHVILITAYDVPGLQETARRLKVNEIIVKPVRPERICQIVEQIINEWKHTKQPIKEEKKAAQKTFKILVADDLPDNVTLLARYIENEGYEHVTARDGVETLEKTRAELPDLVLLDINMPNKDGFTVLEELRADPAIQHIPVIILTAARLDPTDIQSGLTLGADDYVTKPFDRRELMARIRTKLRVKEAEDAMRRRNRELSMLLDITAILNSRGRLDEMLASVLELIVKRLGATAGYIFNFENDVKISFPDSPAAGIDAIQLKAYLDKIHNTGDVRLIDNAQEDRLWRGKVGEAALSAVLAAMSDRRGNLLGAILLTHCGETAYFKPEQVPVLQAIANQTVVAMENAAWYEVVHERRNRSAEPTAR